MRNGVWQMVNRWTGSTSGARRMAIIAAVLVAAALSAFPSTARAEFYSEAYNGATCIPYPWSSSAGIPYQHWLYGFNNSAYCHFPVPNGWLVSQLSYVLFEGT